MKINKNDIDAAIIEKINQFDLVIDNFSEEDLSGFLAFDGEKFYIKRTSDIFLKKISSEEEVENFKDHLYTEKGLLKNSFRTNMNTKDEAFTNFKSLMVSPKEEILFQFMANVIMFKRYSDFLYTFTEKGILIKHSLKDKKQEEAFDLIKVVKTSFAIQDISAYDFISMEAFDGGVLLATRNNGVFLYNIETKEVEILFPESDVVLMKYLGNGLFILGMDRIEDNVAFYNISGMKVEVANTLKKRLFQMPNLVDAYNGKLFLVGRPYSIETAKDIVHYWERDLAGISYNNRDGKIFPGYDCKNYKPRFLRVGEDYTYISGLKDDTHLFVWQYDHRELQKPYKEFLFDKFEFDYLNFADMNEEHFIAAENKHVYFLNVNGKVEKNFLLKEEIKDIFITGPESFIYLSDNKLISVTHPKYTEKEVVLKVHSCEQSCNNIDIFIKSTTGKESIIFIDEDSLAQIVPFYYATFKNDIIIKLLGTTAKNISMKISIPSDSKVEGVVVSPNRLFMK